MRACKEAIVLVGGLGTRLRSVVGDVPKPLASVAGKPFLAYVLDHLDMHGLRRVILATGYGAERIETEFGPRWKSLEIVYSREMEPLGTGGAIRSAKAMLREPQAHVCNGDTYLDYVPSALEEVTRRCAADIGVALARVNEVARYGAVEVDCDRIVAFSEKGRSGPGLISGGSYFLTTRMLEALPERSSFSFEQDVLVPYARLGRVAARADATRFIDIGVPQDFLDAQEFFASP